MVLFLLCTSNLVLLITGPEAEIDSKTGTVEEIEGKLSKHTCNINKMYWNVIGMTKQLICVVCIL